MDAQSFLQSLCSSCSSFKHSLRITHPPLFFSEVSCGAVRAQFPVPSWAFVMAGVSVRPCELRRSDCKTSFFHKWHSHFTFWILSLHSLPGAPTVVNGRHKPGDKLNDSWNPSPRGMCWLFIVAHKHKAGSEFISFRFRWLKWVFEYLKKVVNVYRHLHKSFFISSYCYTQWICWDWL